MEMQKLPYWQDLPDLELYLDQVLLYVNQTTSKSQTDNSSKNLTASMINNYVKHSYLSKPVKKKYRKEQVARLIAITILKNTFPIQTISAELEKLKMSLSSEELYDAFVSYWNKADSKDHIPEVIRAACQTVKSYYKTLKLVEQLESQEGSNESKL
ncbi:DUF1836 domain-containing protein [Streptococcus catagoni]|uniref:DUF1836 domain-containing protein n=1 Tax=Streptococcus catagoni TaxID=2654874 RepID=UPI00140DEF4A|nr:DUF1836 domain-containing protein [Streptococcus catagoni]